MSTNAEGAVRHFGIPYRTAEAVVQFDQSALPNQVFQPLPQPTGPPPYRMSLDSVLPAASMAAIQKAGRLVFHCVGDTGGIKDPMPQEGVVEQMIKDLSSTDPPAFFYHLGDVVYFNGQKNQYYPQFYEPYMHYTIPIVAIPGNHDGDALDPAVEPSLKGFVDNFCATKPQMMPEAQDSQRDAMTQPNVHWTLLTPLVTMIGLYSNCPDGGVIQPPQAAWLQSELAAANKSLPVIVSLHHPLYSADSVHGGNANLAAVLDGAIKGSGRTPDMVLTGHVHNYQRFVRKLGSYQVPYIVAGAGGYHNLHKIALSQSGQSIKLPWQLPAPNADTTLISYLDSQFGYLRMVVTASQIQVTYVGVTPAAVAGQPAVSKVFESFTVDLATHTVH